MKRERFGEQQKQPLVEGIDFYFDEGLMVLTEHYLLERGYCCENGCRHCPYDYAPRMDLKKVDL